MADQTHRSCLGEPKSFTGKGFSRISQANRAIRNSTARMTVLGRPTTYGQGYYFVTGWRNRLPELGTANKVIALAD